MCGNGAFGDDELRGNPAIGETRRNKTGDLSLP
jgi:hypothetical protein